MPCGVHTLLKFTIIFALSCSLLVLETPSPSHAGNKFKKAIGIGIAIGAGALILKKLKKKKAQKRQLAKSNRSGLSRTQVRHIQTSLNDLGFNAGQIDGIMGRGTRSALRKYQTSIGENPSGKITATQLVGLGIIQTASISAASTTGQEFGLNPQNNSVYVSPEIDQILIKTAIEVKRTTGKNVDLATISKMYQQYTNSNRYLEYYEKNTPFGNFGRDILDLRLGEQQAKFAAGLKPTTCNIPNSPECWTAQKNAYLAYVASGALAATTNHVDHDKAGAVAKATIYLSIYKQLESNKSFKGHWWFEELGDQSINLARSWYNSFGRYEGILQLSGGEAGLILLGGSMLGIHGLVALSENVCGAGGCTVNSDTTSQTQISQNKSQCKANHKVCVNSCSYLPNVRQTGDPSFSTPRGKCVASCKSCF